MASTYSPLKVELIGTGEQAGTWGTTTNTNLGTALEEAITGRATATFPSDANFTLPYIDSNAAQVFRNLVLNVTSSGNLSATRDLIIPAIEKQYIVENNTSGSQSIRVKTAAGTGVTIPNGRIANVFCDGTTTRLASDFVDINGGAIDGTPIGASSASTGAFTTATITTATVATGNITTGNITTGNITTGNINTLTVGTQTNKATISYTTNTARTLTIPNVGGNRTFAFIDEAQTFSATQTFNTILVGTQTNKATINYTTNTARTLTIPALDGNRTFAFINQYQLWTAEQSFEEDVVFAKDVTIEDNLIFSGAGTLGYNRIIGEFGTPTLINRTYFQTIAPNTPTSVGVLPTGTATGAAFIARNNSNPTNSSSAGIYVDNDEATFFSFIDGTGSYQPLYIQNGGVARVQIDSNGSIGFNGLPDANTSVSITGGGKTTTLSADGQVKFTSAYGNTVGGTNRSLFIDNTGVIGGLSSTRESKANIATIQDTNWLMALEPVSYNRRNKDAKGVYTDEVNETTEFGLIADDVATVRPEICIFVDGKVSGINYEQLIAPMLKEIQSLRAEIAALKEKVNG